MKTRYIFLLMLTVFITNTYCSPRRYIPKYQQIQNSDEITDTMANSEQSKNATDYNYIDYYFYQKHLFLVVSPCQVCLGSCIGRCAPLGGGYCVCIPIHG